MNLDNAKSAKEYISEAYVTELTAIQAKKQLMETPASIIEKEKMESTLKSAEEIIAMDILSSDITDEYNELNSKIAEKKAELLKLYGIEITEDSLEAIKKAFVAIHDSLSEYIKTNNDEFQEKMSDELKAANDELDALNSETAEKVDAIEAEIAEKKAANKKAVQREADEYSYNLKRSRKQASEAREKLIEERKKQMQEKSDEYSQRLQKVKDELAAIDELKVKVDDIENQLEIARQNGADAKNRELGKEYGYKTAMAEQESNFQISKLKKEFERLDEKYKAVLAENASLAAKLDKCNAESRQLATDTVRSTGGINILNTENGQNNKK